MSIESLLENLRKNADSISQRIYKKRCILARSPDRDCFEQGTMEFAHLEGMLDGIKAAISEVEKHLDTETNLPTSAKRSEDKPPEQIGKDINAPTTPPAWRKEGSWVFYDGYLLARIEGFEKVLEDGSTTPTTYVVLKSYDTSSSLTFTRLPKSLKPVKFRPYRFDEAEKLLGKTIAKSEMIAGNTIHHVSLITRVEHYEKDGGVYINLFDFDWWAANNATIDGIPVGVPEVDEEALGGSAESNGLASCDTCKYVRWLGSSGMQVCEKRYKDNLFPYCYDCATEGGEE